MSLFRIVGLSVAIVIQFISIGHSQERHIGLKIHKSGKLFAYVESLDFSQSPLVRNNYAYLIDEDSAKVDANGKRMINQHLQLKWNGKEYDFKYQGAYKSGDVGAHALFFTNNGSKYRLKIADVNPALTKFFTHSNADRNIQYPELSVWGLYILNTFGNYHRSKRGLETFHEMLIFSEGGMIVICDHYSKFSNETLFAKKSNGCGLFMEVGQINQLIGKEDNPIKINKILKLHPYFSMVVSKINFKDGKYEFVTRKVKSRRVYSGDEFRGVTSMVQRAQESIEQDEDFLSCLFDESQISAYPDVTEGSVVNFRARLKSVQKGRVILECTKPVT